MAQLETTKPRKSPEKTEKKVMSQDSDWNEQVHEFNSMTEKVLEYVED